MSGGITGDFAGLADLIDRIGHLATPEFRREVSAVLAEEALTQIALGFRQGVDPDGVPWKPSRRASLQGGQTLRDTGRLANSWSRGQADLEVRPDGFTIGTNVRYARIHQFGGDIRPVRARALRFQTADGQWHTRQRVRIPQRAMVPTGGALPPRWDRAFRREAEEIIREGLGQ